MPTVREDIMTTGKDMKKMKQLTAEETKRIQCDLLQDIASYCEEKGLTFFLAYGTLIGAMRHNGFIPWDDDIDIAMPRPDYDEFVSTYNQRDSHCRVIDTSFDKDYGISFAKVYDDRTWLDEFKYRKDKYGVYIDVFPVEGVGGKVQVFLARKLSRLMHAKKANFTDRGLLKNLSNCVLKLLMLPFSLHTMLRFADWNARRHPFGTTSKASVLFETYGWREVVDTAAFQGTVLHEFEGRQYPVPVGYDRWLRSIYGDYMQLPPKEHQVGHHEYNAYWKE